MIKNKQNKKGNIPVTILVIGVFAICTLTILSFIVFSYNTSKHFVGPGLIETILSMEEELKFNNNPYSFNQNGVRITTTNNNIEGNYTLENGKVLVSIRYELNK